MKKQKLEEWAEILLSTAMAKCGNLDDAEDLTQDPLLTYYTYKAKANAVDKDMA